ncbi:hypothetical protein GQ44DRAFT_665803 [Phaeosphaeriaceae sp. PMI808]|nr:hypothetical protein GQ44DRAFT_665803 [Phaeosphaeriaceae sp. PMI808]
MPRSGGGEDVFATIPGAPVRSEPLGPRQNFDPTPGSYTFSGGSVTALLGKVALARSGDKGSNVNISFFSRDPAAWPWLQSFLPRDRMKNLMGDVWDEASMFVERVEFPKIQAVHFVMYGSLGAGVSSSARLDSLGKGLPSLLLQCMFLCRMRSWLC